MAYLGNNPSTQSFTSGTDYFSGTGSQTAYTLTRTVNSVNDIEVVINNVVQQPSTAYTLSGTTITFTSAPSSGTNNIYVRYLATNMQSFTVPANSITRTQLDSNLQAGFQGRNKIINGAMTIAQYGTGSTSVQTTSDYCSCDRWKIGASVNSKYTIQQSSTAPTGFSNSLLATSSSAYTVGAAENFTIQQRIEGFNTSDLAFGTAAAKTVTLSFWVQSSLTGTFGGSLCNSAFNRTYPFTYTISSANTWTQISVTIAGDAAGTWIGATNGVGLIVYFSLGAGSNFTGTNNTWNSGFYLGGSTSLVGTSGATFYITGVQLEEGTTATSFEREIYSVTLQKCQRYYQIIDDFYFRVYQTGSAYAGQTVTLPVKMRTSPTVAIVGTWGVSNCGQPTAATNGSSTQAVQVYALWSTTGNGKFSADASSQYVSASAEL